MMEKLRMRETGTSVIVVHCWQKSGVFDTLRPKSAEILGLNPASTSKANFGLTASCLVRLHLQGKHS